MKTIAQGETLLLEAWERGDEIALKSLIERYRRIVFNLMLYLGGGGRNAAFNLSVACFSETLNSLKGAGSDGRFFHALVRDALRRCEAEPVTPAFDLASVVTLPPEKREPLRIIQEALFALSFQNKTLLLLRDQFNLSYEDISAILDVPAKDARSAVLLARVQLRDKVQEILDSERGRHGLR